MKIKENVKRRWKTIYAFPNQQKRKNKEKEMTEWEIVKIETDGQQRKAYTENWTTTDTLAKHVWKKDMKKRENKWKQWKLGTSMQGKSYDINRSAERKDETKWHLFQTR